MSLTPVLSPPLPKSHPLRPGFASGLLHPLSLSLNFALSEVQHRELLMDYSAEEDDAPHEAQTQCLTKQELRIAKVLLKLPELFRKCENRKRCHSSLNLRWSRKGKRSKRSCRRIDAVGPTPAAAPAPAPAFGSNEQGPGLGPSKRWTDASSPDTPLTVTYSGGSSDPKSCPVAAASKKKSMKLTMEELRLAESVALKEREGLQGEIQILRRMIESKKSLNRELKTAQKLLISSPTKGKAQLEKVDTGLTLGTLSSPSSAGLVYPHFGIPGVSGRSVPTPMAIGVDKSSNAMVKSVKPAASLLGPRVDSPPVPNLNLPVEENGQGLQKNSGLPEHLTLDSRFLSKEAAAKARQRRYLIVKSKLRRSL
ncbi:hypothetical protein SAY87_022237 [Trapa incisa]|uniref:Uncharacterized protein n=1 Tax=Trapa incisa TaxID=236973 RepID=A0AAN7PTA8_9MYRT|nr:hypothetical protein SAY87_022237 [Trapa incisa]